MDELNTGGQEAPAIAPAPAQMPAGSSDSTPPASLPPPRSGNENDLTPKEAAQRLARRRMEKLREQAAANAAPPVSAPAAPPAEQSPPQAGDAAQPAQAAPGEAPAVDPAVEQLPPIEPPRAWKAEYKAAFEALPRAVQEQVAESERAREADFRQRQHEVTEREKAFSAELQQVQYARQQYEQGLQTTLQMLQTGNEFGDITTQEQVDQLAQENWPKWVRYMNHIEKVRNVQANLEQVQRQNYEQRLHEWNSYASEQDSAFDQKVPDAKVLREAAGPYLSERGFSQQEIQRYWNSAAWRDHRMQTIIGDAIRYQQGKAKAAQAIKAPLPEVVKPGVSAPKVNPFQSQIAELEAKGSLSIREAAKLSQLRRMASAKK